MLAILLLQWSLLSQTASSVPASDTNGGTKWNLPVDYIQGGVQRQMSLSELLEMNSPGTKRVEAVLRRGTASLRPDQLAAFAAGLSVPAAVISMGELSRFPRARFYFHVDMPKLFDAELTCFERFIAKEAYIFTHCPPIEKAQFDEAVAKLDLILKGWLDSLVQAGLDRERTKNKLDLWREVFIAEFGPPRYGYVGKKLSDEQVDALQRKLRPSSESDSKIAAQDIGEQWSIISNQFRQVVMGALVESCPALREGPGSEAERLRRALHEATRELRSIQATTRPATASAPATSATP